MACLDQCARERFASQIELIPFSDCHYWTGQLCGAGYGMFQKQRAHRISYEMEKGPIPDIGGKPAMLLHSCDNPLCVNPAHLRPGTQVENMMDAAIRKRMPRGERHHNNKLSDADVSAILEACERGESTGALANRYRVSPGRISDIRNGRVGINHLARGRKMTGRADRRMSDERALALYRRAIAGESPTALAQEFGAKYSFVQDVKRGNTYALVTGHWS
jgi:hypothetical protein